MSGPENSEESDQSDKVKINYKTYYKLLNLGYKVGPIDGIYGSQTRAAVKAYQKKKGLPTGGLTLETVRSLGYTK